MPDLIRQWLDALAVELPAAATLRRALHQNPRVSGQEDDTAVAVAGAMDLEATPFAKTGGALRIGPSGPAIGLRGELDALPVIETTGLDWGARNGAMHACGHDVHLAALTAVVRAARDLPLPYGLVAVLQPREEAYPSGAADMVSEGLLEQFEIARMVGVHVHPRVDKGAVATGAGLVNAAAGELRMKVEGRGGHGAYPHHGSDVAAAVAHIVTGLPEILRRTVDPMDQATISVGTIRVGHGAANVLPGEGEIIATIRNSSQSRAAVLAQAVVRLVQHQAAAFDCVGSLDYVEGEPELVNDTQIVTELDQLLPAIGLTATEPMRSLGADDFSFFSDAVPSTMSFVGVDSGSASLHDASFLPDEGALERVAKTFIAAYAASAIDLQNRSS
ncbi:MAG: M20 metallopeptidase family protein [Gulosibacter sp.]|uniref:M20 metallopeptidase family protein n=1 Tax=Gulosibacter sp. TaxID=2817531 RepID=UPI003F9109DD